MPISESRRLCRNSVRHLANAGFKPSRGRMSFGPDVGEGWGGMSTAHVVCRSVRDCAVMLDCTAGAEPGDPYTAPPPEHPFLEALPRLARSVVEVIVPAW